MVEGLVKTSQGLLQRIFMSTVASSDGFLFPDKSPLTIGKAAVSSQGHYNPSLGLFIHFFL